MYKLKVILFPVENMKEKTISFTTKKNVDLIITHSIKNKNFHLDASAGVWNVVLYRAKIRLRAKVSGIIL